MKIQKKLFKSGGSLMIIIGKEILNGKNLKKNDVIELDINSIEKVSPNKPKC